MLRLAGGGSYRVSRLQVVLGESQWFNPAKRAGTTDDPSGAILAPLFEMSIVRRSVVASPFSVIQADCCRIILRTSRLVVFGFIRERQASNWIVPKMRA